jgi:hypothetical protein
MNSLTIGLAVLAISTATLAGNNHAAELIRQNPGAYPGNPTTAHPGQLSGATNPRTGEFYAPAAGGGLTGTRDGRLLVPAGPNGYIDTRTGAFVPAH